MRGLGRVGGRRDPVAGERFPGVVCLLATGANEPADWVVAGQALQRVLLRAAASGVAVALHSQPLELPQLRDFIRVQLAARAHPQLIIRLGLTRQASTTSTRRPVADVPPRLAAVLAVADEQGQPGLAHASSRRGLGVTLPPPFYARAARAVAAFPGRHNPISTE